MTDAVTLSLELGFDPPARTLAEGGELHLVARVAALGTPVDGMRPKLCVVFVLDASSSMAGEPIEQVLDSVARLVDLLLPTDQVGVVAFADDATVVHPLHALDATTKGGIKRRIASVRAHGNTNIQAGLRAASSLWGARAAQERRVIVLLSDGAPNREATTSDALIDVVTPLRNDATVVTLGYGPGHNADVLASVARAGGGSYWFIPEPKEANLEFARALGAQGDVVVDGVDLLLAPADGVEVIEVLGASGKTRVSAHGLLVPLPDLRSGGEHIVVARVTVPAQREAGRAVPLVVKARWRRAGAPTVHTVDGALGLDVFRDARPVARQPWVVQAIVLSKAEIARGQGRGHADRGNFDAAAALLRQTMKEIEQAPGYVQNDGSPLAEAYEQLVDEVMAYETRPSAETYHAFRSAQLGVNVQQGGKHVAQDIGASAKAMVGGVTGTAVAGEIVVSQGSKELMRVPIQNELTIGRVHGNDIVLPSGNLSKRHTRVVCRDGRIFVVDLKSTNGTFMNGKRLSSPQELRSEDVLFIGDFKLRLELSKK